MRFNLVLANQSASRLQELEDMLRPLLVGLRAAGHSVVAGAHDYKMAPVINLIVEDFTDAGFVSALTQAREQTGGAFRFGVICPVNPAALSAERRAGLRSLLPSSDFVLTLAGIEIGPEFCPSGRVVPLTYGFDEKLVGPRLITDPGLRDIDVVIYSPACDRVNHLGERLAKANIGHLTVRPGAMPDYLVTDLLSRAKVVAVIDDQPATGALGPRIVKAVCNGALVVTEPPTPAGEWHAGALIHSLYDDIPAQCRTLVAEGQYAKLGLDALDRFRSGVSMRECITNALNLPPLAALRGS